MSEKAGKHVFSHTMSNGTELEMREIPGFGNRSEVGFFIKDVCIGTFLIDSKRTGNVEVKPTMMRQQRISDDKPEAVYDDQEESIEGPSLSDITVPDDD